MNASGALAPSERSVIVQLAQCRNIQCVDRSGSQSNNEIVRQISAMRRFQFSRDRSSARVLLTLLPKTEGEFEKLYSLTAGGGQVTDEMVSNLYERDWERSVADAVLITPELLSDYLSYGGIAVSDVHSGYYEHVSRVCRANRKRFRETLATLPQDTRRYLTDHVVNPRTCEHYGEE
jgi:hypothetical protein